MQRARALPLRLPPNQPCCLPRAGDSGGPAGRQEHARDVRSRQGGRGLGVGGGRGREDSRPLMWHMQPSSTAEPCHAHLRSSPPPPGLRRTLTRAPQTPATTQPSRLPPSRCAAAGWHGPVCAASLARRVLHLVRVAATPSGCAGVWPPCACLAHEATPRPLRNPGHAQ